MLHPIAYRWALTDSKQNDKHKKYRHNSCFNYTERWWILFDSLSSFQFNSNSVVTIIFLEDDKDSAHEKKWMMIVSLLAWLPVAGQSLNVLYTSSQDFSSCLIIFLLHRRYGENIEDPQRCIRLYFWLSIPFVLSLFLFVGFSCLSISLPYFLLWCRE